MSKEFATQVVKQLTDAGYLAYWAGGCVRDMLLGKPASDFDVATSATPQQVRELFGHKRTHAVGESFGVILVLGPRQTGDKVEVATFRNDGQYVDGRRPESVSFSSPEEDAQRRDFTINGMFYDPLTEQVLDYVGGLGDLHAKVLRAIGDPAQRMREDKLRMLRAVRFTATLQYQLDEQTAAAIRGLVPEIRVVSAERIAVELRKMLAHSTRDVAMELCRSLGLLEILLPEVEELSHDSVRWSVRMQMLRALKTTDADVALAALLGDVPVGTPAKKVAEESFSGTVLSVCRRLKFSNDQTEHILWLSNQRGVLQSIPNGSLAAAKKLAAHEWCGDLVEIERARAVKALELRSSVEWMDEFRSRTPRAVLCPPELLTGRDLQQQGYLPGPLFKEWLDRIRDEQLNENIASRDEALALVRLWATQGDT